jgi:dihydroorotase (multifunctional complex type)
MPSLLIESAQILVGEELTHAHIFLEDGVIKNISKIRPTSTPDQKIDASHLIALPGMIDAHVHLRDLEFSYKETFETGTRAAAVGGFTTVFDMPNSRPPTVSPLNLADKMAKAEGRLYSNVAFQGSLVDDPNEMKGMVEQGAIAFKLYLNKALVTFDSSNQTDLMNALQAAKQAGAIVTVHAEDGDRIRKSQQESIRRGKTSIRDFLRAHAPQIEVYAVRKILGLGSKLGLRLHICHITVPEAVNLVRMAPNATCEASAHHLLLNQTVFRKQKTLAICVPPIRSEANRNDLWRLFAKGNVDILASDHAPHTLEEKTKENAWDAASGVPGLETSLPVMFTQVSQGKLTLRRLVDATATLPAKLFRLPKKGELKEGYDADIVLVDPKAKTRIAPESFESKAKYSPFKGYRCVGMAAYTIVNGTLVAERGRIVGDPVGKVTKSDRAWASS